MTYRFTEHGKGYKLDRTLQSWRPQFDTIVSWVPAGSRVLDVGCGDGVLGARFIQEKGCAVWGFDLDATGVLESKRKEVRAIVHDADRKFPYKTNQFDFVICNELLEFVDNPNFVIEELLRVGSHAIVEFPNFGFWLYRLEHLAGHFPRLALYGHHVWESRQTKFFTYADFLLFPAVKKSRIRRTAGIDWKNRRVSWLASRFPNVFARSVIIEIKK